MSLPIRDAVDLDPYDGQVAFFRLRIPTPANSEITPKLLWKPPPLAYDPNGARIRRSWTDKKTIYAHS
jgi:hypothetical protein